MMQLNSALRDPSSVPAEHHGTARRLLSTGQQSSPVLRLKRTGVVSTRRIMVRRLLVLALAALVLLQAQPGVDAARILVVIAMPAPSHLIVFTGLTRVLAERGHHITLCAAFEKGHKLIPTKNHEFVSIQNAEIDKFKNDAVIKVMKGEQFNFRSMLNFVRLGPKMMRATLENSDFQALINKPGQKFDLIVTEVFFMHEALLPLGHKFDAPVIALNPFGISSQLADVMGNPFNPSWVPNPFLGFSDRMSFTERAINTLMTSFFYLSHRFFSLPAQQAMATEFFPDAPPLEELLTSRLSLCLINNHFSMSYPVPMSPGIVEVGGMHIPDKPKPLPKDLQDFLDGGKEGVIYFSMGSNLRMDLLEEKKVHAIFNALGAVKERVLMKWDGPIPKGIASNIRAVNWAPQSDILAHPNIRLFVTHGGLLSTQETVYHGVPTVGIPVMADQAFNLKFAVSKGYAVQLDFATLTEEALSAAIKESLQNPKYKQAVSKLSQLFRAKPMRPADTAVFWVEHVLQHGGDHLRPAVVHLPLYQSLLLDILAALALAIALLFLVLRTAYRALCWCFCSRKRDPVKTARGKKTN